MTTKKTRISAAAAKRIGSLPGVDWAFIPREELRRGMEVELEHGARDGNPGLSLTLAIG